MLNFDHFPIRVATLIAFLSLLPFTTSPVEHWFVLNFDHFPIKVATLIAFLVLPYLISRHDHMDSTLSWKHFQTDLNPIYLED